MDKMREAHVKEMERLSEAMGRTRSKYLLRDYKKAYFRMAEQLREYDKFKSAVNMYGE